MLAIAGFGTAGDLCLAQAFRDGQATAVIPFDFTKLVWVALIGYFAFDEIPDAGIWIRRLDGFVRGRLHRQSRTQGPRRRGGSLI